MTTATRTFDRDEAALARVNAFLAAHLPDMAGEPFRTKTCLYTLTPDRDFVLDALPDHPGVLVALGSAHGYKFASLIGRIMAELALDGETPSAPEIEAFGIGRAALTGRRQRRRSSSDGGQSRRDGPPDGGGCGDPGRVRPSGARADGDRRGRGNRGGAVRRLPGGLFPDDPAIPPPSRAAVDRGRTRDFGAVARRRTRRRGGSRRAHRRPRRRTSTRRTRSTLRSSRATRRSSSPTAC